MVNYNIINLICPKKCIYTFPKANIKFVRLSKNKILHRWKPYAFDHQSYVERERKNKRKYAINYLEDLKYEMPQKRAWIDFEPGFF